MVSWGAWEGGSLQMRVGLEVNVEGGITHGEAGCTINVEYWTENNFSWDDDQSLNLGGAIGGSIGFHNGQGGTPVKRGERSYVYSYGPNEYKTNATRTFSATLNGAFNGITPSKSVTVNIPDRPFAAPVAPNQVNASRVNDGANKITWNNRPTAGEPYTDLQVNRTIYGRQDWTRVANLGGGAEAYTDSNVIANRKYRYQVRAVNNVGGSAWIDTDILWTTPATPTGCTRTELSSTSQRIDWTNNVDYSEYTVQVYVSTNGGSWSFLTERAGPATTYTHTTVAGNRYKYRVRARTSAGELLYSSYSGETTESSGTTTPPSAPTNLAPDGGLIVDPTALIVLSWKHNGIPGQTKYEVQYRVDGGSWVSTGEQTKTATSHTLDPGTFGYEEDIEWQVRTWGNDPSPSSWSATALFGTRTAVAVKYPLVLDVTSGRVEADSAGTAIGGAPTPAHHHRYRADTSNHVFASGPAEPLLFNVLDDELGGQISYTNTGGVFTFNDAGVFDIACGLVFNPNGTGRRLLAAIHSRLGTLAYDGQASTGSTADTSCELSFTFVMQAGDTLYFHGQQNAGVTLGANVGRQGYWARITRIDSGTGPTGPQGPPGTTPTVGYTFVQATPLSTWVIDHSLSYQPAVTVVDSSGRQVEGDVVYTDADTITIGFSGAFAGKAYLS